MKKMNFTIPNFARNWLVLLAVLLATFSFNQAGAQCVLPVEDEIDVVLNDTCGARLTMEMFLTDDGASCTVADHFEFEVLSQDGSQVIYPRAEIVDLDYTDIGKTYMVILWAVDAAGNDINSGMSMFDVVDKLAPKIDCPTDTIDLPCYYEVDYTPTLLIPECNKSETWTMINEVVKTNNCTDASIPVNVLSFIDRDYLATDASGNVSEPCHVTIRVNALTDGEFYPPDVVDPVIGLNAAIGFPEDLVKADKNAISCEDADDYKKEDGTFDPNKTGWPYLFYFDRNPTPEEIAKGDFTDTVVLDNSCNDICNLTSTYIDIKVNTCEECLEKTVRTWTVVENSCQYPERFRLNIQTIEVVDTVPPVIVCPDDMTITTNTFGGFGSSSDSDFNCGAMFTFPVPEMYDSCKNDVVWTISVANASDLATPIMFADTNATKVPVTKVLPYGKNKVVYTAYDQCGNSDSCTWYVTVEDKTPPVAICQQFTTVSLTVDGTAIIAAHNFDSGSYDDCALDSIRVRRMDDKIDCEGNVNTDPDVFFDYVHFCCDDIPNNNIVVIMRVWDKQGLHNDCMVQVEVQDKLPPSITCPKDICVPCDYPFEIDSMNNYFGTVVLKQEDRETNVVSSIDSVGYYYYKLDADGKIYWEACSTPALSSVSFLDGYVIDNCGVLSEDTYVDERDQCGNGNIVRTFTAHDNNGSVSCRQYIHFDNKHPFDENDIDWPKDTTLVGCYAPGNYDPELTGFPLLHEDNCDLVGFTYKDQVFGFNDDDLDAENICFKIIRTWTVMDWCQDDGYGHYLTWEKDQVIMVSEYNAPTFTTDCAEKTTCTYDAACEGGYIELPMSAEDDCTQGEDLRWRYRIDLDNDGSFDIDSRNFVGGASIIRGATASASGEYPIGKHRIVWEVWDQCGNIATCDTYFTINNCKKPTPICIDHIVVEMMPVDNGTDGIADWAMIEVGPQLVEHCCHASSHPCGYDLTYSFSEDPNDVSRVFYCGLDTIHDNWYPVDPIVGNLTEVRMYVTAHLPNGETTTDYCVTNIDFQDNNNACDPTIPDGLVQLSGLITNIDNEPIPNVSVELQGSEMAPMNTGVNGTYEFGIEANRNYIVAPQKEGLDLDGVTTLDIVLIQKHILGISKINNPYKLLAANINGDNNVTAADISIMRKLILAKIEDMGDAWMFVDKGYEFENPERPYNEEVVTSTPVNTNEDVVVDFYGIKMGDINLSLDVLEARSSEKLQLTVDAVQFESGVVEVPVYAENINGVEGFQYTFSFDNKVLSFEGVESGKLEITNANIGATRAANGMVAMSWNWNSSNVKNISSEDVLFTLKFNAVSGAKLQDVLSLTSDIAKKEAYDSNLNVMGVELEYRGENAEYALYQNTPNPFTEYTDISFTLPQKSECTISIYDLTGKVVKVISNEFEEGRNSVRVNKSDLNVSGILYYVLETEEFTATKKMIILK